jgi:hypothetical protein
MQLSRLETGRLGRSTPPAKPVALVSMPTLSGRFPSFQLGLLKPFLENQGFSVQPFSLFMYFGTDVGWAMNEVLAEVWPSLVGEWIWSKAAFGEHEEDPEYFEVFERNFHTICKLAGCSLADLRRLRDDAAPRFIDFCVDSVDWSRFGLVGFSLVFQQLLARAEGAPSLAADHLRRRRAGGRHRRRGDPRLSAGGLCVLRRRGDFTAGNRPGHSRRREGKWVAGPDVAEIALLTLALCETSDQALRQRWVPRLAAALWSRIDAHGRVSTHADEAAVSDAYQDYFSGQVLLALDSAARAGLAPIDETKFARAFRYYRHRFQARPRFGQVSWLAQACLAWWRVKADPRLAALACEIADWILGFQQQKSGAFLNDHQSDTPGYTTALYLEGLAAASCLAGCAGNTLRQREYLEACRRGFQFLDGLIIQSRDTSLLPNPALAIGGLRRSMQSSEVCINFVQHYLAALIEVCEATP